MGRTALAIGGVLLIGAGLALALGWIGRSTANTDSRVTQPIRTVRIDVGSGDVRVRASDVATTTVHQHFSYHWRGEPDDAYRVEGDELVLADCGRLCSVDYDVTVPRGTQVRGESRSGTVRLEDPGPVDVRSTSGDIEVTLSDPETVRASASSGDIRLTVPDARFRVEGKTNSGARRIDVANDPNSPYVLDLTTTSGDVVVRQR